MKRLTLKTLVFLTGLLFTSWTMAQQTSIEHNSNNSNPHVELIEDDDDGFTRIFFKNSSSTDKWALAGTLGSGSVEKYFGFYYNSFPRVVYNEKNKGLGIGTANPLAKLHVESGNVYVKNSTARISVIATGGSALLALGDDVGGTDASLSYSTSSKNLTMTTTSSLGRLLFPRKSGFGISSNLTSQVTIQANSGNTSTPAQLNLRENNNSFSTLMFSNTEDGNWFLEAQSQDNINANNASFNLAYDPDGIGNPIADYNIMHINGGRKRMGINTSAPLANLHIKQTSSEAGLMIENNSNVNQWGFNIGTADLNVIFNGANVGFFEDSDGTYNAVSDRRLKNNIKPMNQSVLGSFMRLQPKTYFYNHTPNQKRPSMGYIAQELLEIFPDVVSKHEEIDQYMVNYSKIGVITVKAVQEVYQEVESLREENKEMKKELNRLTTLVNQLVAEK